MDKVLTAIGKGGQLAVEGDWVVINRAGFTAKMTQGLKGTKRIPISSITAVQFKTPGLQPGYIQFSIHGGRENRAGVYAATYDENTVMFRTPELAKFDAIRKYVEQRISELSRPHVMVAAPDVADQLRKFADLRAAGVLTDSEFESQKAKLLA